LRLCLSHAGCSVSSYGPWWEEYISLLQPLIPPEGSVRQACEHPFYPVCLRRQGSGGGVWASLWHAVPCEGTGSLYGTDTTVGTTDQLFVCYGERVMGAELSKQRLSHWIVDTITTAYRLAGRPVLGSVVPHSTRGVAASWALLRGVPLADICAAASWASSCTFARYYWVNVAPPTAVGSAVLGAASPSGDYAWTPLPH
jgi:hypothetical protein